MSALFGAFGVFSVRSRPGVGQSVATSGSPLDRLLGLIQFRSFFFCFLFVVVLFILAYLTNPSEASFRTFLTELSFRRHLTKLNDSQESNGAKDEQNGLHFTTTSSPSRQHDGKRKTKDRGSSFNKSDQGFSTATAITSSYRFHFASRASVSLRTPTHIFRSFGFLTIAAVTPPAHIPPGSALSPRSGDRSQSSLAGSWFIGAFGKWWIAGEVELLHKDTVPVTKGDDVRVGVLSMQSHEYDGLNMPGGLKLPMSFRAITSGNGHDESNHAVTLHVPSRSSSPPPLPKSVSLPLHSVGITPGPSSAEQRPTTKPMKISHHPSISIPTSLVPPECTHDQPRSRATSLRSIEQSPVVAEIIKQITASQNSLAEIHSQLTTFHSTSSASHSSLQSSLEEQRQKKREEDVARQELKSQTKALEDSKRQADSAKRDSEKKLKVVQSARDRAANRLEKLAREIEKLHSKMADDQKMILNSDIELAKSQETTAMEMELKRHEIRAAEDDVTSLSSRVRELEDKIKDEKARMVKVKAEIAAKRAGLRPTLPGSHSHSSSFPPPYLPRAAPPSLHFAGVPSLYNPPMPQRRSIPAGIPEPLIIPSRSEPFEVSPRRSRVPSLTRARNFFTGSDSLSTSPIAVRNSNERTSPIYEQASHLESPSSSLRRLSFSPFSDSDPSVASPRYNNNRPISPFTTSLIPTSLFQSLDVGEGTTPSPKAVSPTDSFFFSPTDPNGSPLERTMTGEIRTPERSPDGLYVPSFPDSITSNRLDDQRASLNTKPSQPIILVPDETDEDVKVPLDPPKAPRRWFSVSGKEKDPAASKALKEIKEKSGLNPDAKVFSFTRGKSFLLPGNLASDSANTTAASSSASLPIHRIASLPTTTRQTSLASTFASPPSANFFSSFLAFKPSPAEREAFRQALSANASHDRLSDPSSPSLTYQSVNSALLVPTSPFTSPLQSARTSAVDLNMVDNSAAHAAWSAAEEKDKESMFSFVPSPPHKRSFASLWNRRKAAAAAENGNGAAKAQGES